MTPINIAPNPIEQLIKIIATHPDTPTIEDKIALFKDYVNTPDLVGYTPSEIALYG